MVLRKICQHRYRGAVGGYAEHDLRGREAIAGEEILGHGGPERRVLERRGWHGKHEPSPRAFMGHLKLPHVEGGHGSGERKVGVVLREGRGLSIAEHRRPIGHGPSVGAGEEGGKAAAKALPPMKKAQTCTIILEHGLKALAQGVLE
jgi:hypothetical protein